MKSKEKIIYVKVVSTKPRKNRLLKCLGWSNFTVLFNWNKHQSPSSFPPPSPCSTSPPQTGHSHSLPVLLVSNARWGTGELDKASSISGILVSLMKKRILAWLGDSSKVTQLVSDEDLQPGFSHGNSTQPFIKIKLTVSQGGRCAGLCAACCGCENK